MGNVCCFFTNSYDINLFLVNEINHIRGKRTMIKELYYCPYKKKKIAWCLDHPVWKYKQCKYIIEGKCTYKEVR